MGTSSIRRLIKVAAKRAQLNREIAQSLSGHSMRVGAAQDMLVAGTDMIGIMHAGGWKTHAVLSRYVENASAELMHERRWDKIKLLTPTLLSPSVVRGLRITYRVCSFAGRGRQSG